MDPDIILNRDSVEVVGGTLEVKDDLEVDGGARVNDSLRVGGLLHADGLRVGRNILRATENGDRRTVYLSADQIRFQGDVVGHHAQTRSLSSGRIETSSIVVGTPAGEEGGTADDDDDPVIRPPGGYIPDLDLDDPVIIDPEIPTEPFEPDLPDPIGPDGPLGPSGPIGPIGPRPSPLMREASREGTDGMPGADESTVGTITLRDAEGENSIVLDAASGRIFVKGVGDVLAKMAALEARVGELEARVAELEG
jgi:hypothetical protein